MKNKLYIFFSVVWMVLFSFNKISCAQDADSLFKPTIFVYSEDDSPVAMDIGGGVGTDNMGLRAGLAVNLDMYHILAGFHYNISLSYRQIQEKSFILGYRFRTYNYMISAASGICRQKYKCTSGRSGNCYDFKEESLNAIPLNFEADWILTDSFAMGVGFNHVFSKRQNVTAVTFRIKYGAFRNIY